MDELELIAISKGEKGDVGPKGDKGDKGDKGEQGTTNWTGITNKPTTFNPSSHVHNWNELTSGQISSIPGSGSSTHAHGSISILGSKNTYSGIAFPDANAVFMIRNSDALSGVYVNNNIWRWYFDGLGILRAGTIPDERTSANTENFANTIVKRNSASDIKCRLVRQEYVPNTGTNIGNIVTTRVPGKDTDNFLRHCTLPNFRAAVTDPFYWKKSELIIEEGTYSPELTTVQNPTPLQYSSRFGHYKKIDNLVYFYAEFISNSTFWNGFEHVALTLPFDGKAGVYQSVNIFQMTGFNLSSEEWIIGAAYSVSAIVFYKQTNTMSAGLLRASDSINNHLVRVNGTYLI